MKIFKYPLETNGWIGDRQARVAVPMGAIILSCQVQDGELCLWMLVNEFAQKQVRTFYVFGTGHSLPQDIPLNFIATVQAGPYVWHVFEETV